VEIGGMSSCSKKETEVVRLALSLADPKYLCPTLGASAGCSRSLILHGDFLWILNLYLTPALHTISLRHDFSLLPY